MYYIFICIYEFFFFCFFLFEQQECKSYKEKYNSGKEGKSKGLGTFVSKELVDSSIAITWSLMFWSQSL